VTPRGAHTAGTPGDDDEFVIAGSDSEQAAVQLGAWLQEHGTTVLAVAEGGVRVADGDIRVILEPKLGEGRDLDRIVALRFFAAKDEWRGSKEILDFANQLDQKYNIGGFYVDGDGDLAFQTQITFMDRLSWNEMRAFFDWLRLTFTALIARESEPLGRYMK